MLLQYDAYGSGVLVPCFLKIQVQCHALPNAAFLTCLRVNCAFLKCYIGMYQRMETLKFFRRLKVVYWWNEAGCGENGDSPVTVRNFPDAHTLPPLLPQSDCEKP